MSGSTARGYRSHCHAHIAEAAGESALIVTRRSYVGVPFMDRRAALTIFNSVLSTLLVAACTAPVVPQPPSRDVPITARDPYTRIDRWIAAARSGFQPDEAMAIVRVADQGFRSRGNAAYTAVLDAVKTALRDGGFSTEDASVAREILASSALIWDPRSASLEIVEPAPQSVLAFDAADDFNRTMLVAYSISGDFTGELDLGAGTGSLAGRILLTDEHAAHAQARAVERGAVAVLSAATEPFNDTSHHPETVRYDTLAGDRASAIPLLDVSPQAAASLRAALARGKVVVHVRTDVSLRTGNAETLVARIAGRTLDAAPIVLVAHVDEPGANDNGSGVGALAQCAVTYLRLIRAGTVPPPERPIVFLFGTEMESSVRWIETHAAPRPVFALALDMAGEPPEMSPMLIERMPDPGAMHVRDFDAHTAWFSGSSPRSVAAGSFLTGYAISVFKHVDRGWPVHDHPFEGGSDHVPFLTRSIPALLFWHFPDDAYHTNRDRLARVSAAEITRVASGLIALLAHGAVCPQGAQLALAFVEIDSYDIHGWPPDVCLAARR